MFLVADSIPGDNGSMVTIATGGGNLVNKLNFGVSSVNNYAWIQSVKPGTDVYPLLLNPSGGNVGINTTAPIKKLHVQTSFVSGAARGGGFTQVLFESNQATASYWEFQANASSTNDILFSKSSVGGSSYGIVGYDHATDALRFYTNGGEKVRIDGAGNVLVGTATSTGTASQPLQVTGGAYVSGSVGIGTINPTSKLDVVGSIRAVTSTTSATTVRIGNTGNNVFLGVESSTGGTNIIGSTAYAGTLSSNGPLQFSINNGASIQATINASGNVGIGTATPIAKLDVSGDVRVSGVVTASDTTLISLDGTSAVRQRFFPSSGTGNFNWQIAAQTNVNNGFEITPSSASGGSTFSTPAITVKSDGKVGIGVTGPGTTLGVAGNAQFGGSGGVAGVSSYVDTIGILGSSGSSISQTAGIQFGDNWGAASRQWGIYNGRSATGTNVGALSFVVSSAVSTDAMSGTGSTPLTLLSSGNVGIGTTSPGSLLHLSTAGASYLQIQNTTAANSVYFGNSSGNGIIQVDGANSLNISTNGSERCRVDSSGRLLVGTSSTSADTRAIIQGRSSAGDSTGRLHISSGNDTPGDGDGIAELHFTSSGHVASGRIAAQRDGGTWTAGSSLPTRLTFSTTADADSSPTERMRIKADGDVSIVTGNLIIGTAGKGIDFSATTNPANKYLCLTLFYSENNPNGIIRSISSR
jgi:hypothetical protein